MKKFEYILQEALKEDKPLEFYEIFCILRDAWDAAFEMYFSRTGFREKSSHFQVYK